MLGVDAEDPYDAFALDDLALVAHLFNTRSHFHRSISSSLSVHALGAQTRTRVPTPGLGRKRRLYPLGPEFARLIETNWLSLFQR